MRDTATLPYETACTRIEDVIRRLDSGEAGLRETLELCQEGRRLVEFCASELEAVGRGLEELRLQQAVARARRPRARGAAARRARGAARVGARRGARLRVSRSGRRAAPAARSRRAA